MNEREVKQLIREKAPPDSKLRNADNPFVDAEVLRTEVGILQQKKPEFTGFGQRHVSEVIVTATEKQHHYLSLEPGGERVDTSRVPTTDEVISSEVLFDLLQPWRDFLRKAGSGQTEASFETFEEAGNWVEGTADIDAKRFYEAHAADLGKAGRGLAAFAERLDRDFGLDLALKELSLSYIGSNGAVKTRRVWSGMPRTFLWKLADRLSFLEAATFVPQALLTAWVLTDIMPVITAVSVERQVSTLPPDLLEPTWGPVEIGTKDRSRFIEDLGGVPRFKLDASTPAPPGGVERRKFIVTLHHGSLKKEDLRQANSLARAFFGRKRGKSVSAAHFEIWELVRAHGGPPGKGAPRGSTRQFFDKILAEFNVGHCDRAHGRLGGWKSVQRAYQGVLRTVGPVKIPSAPQPASDLTERECFHV